MKKLLPVFIIVLIAGVTMFTPHRCVADNQKVALDTFSCILESGDSFYYVLNSNKDTVDWWYDNKGIKLTKKQFETAISVTDSLLRMGYKKGFIND